CYITNANFADTLILTAVTGKQDNGKNIISAIIVPTNTPGITITAPYDKMGVRGSDTAQIVLKDVRVPKENLLGGETNGSKQFLKTLDSGRISNASLAIGIAKSSQDHTIQYA